MTALDFPELESQKQLVSRLKHLFGFSFPFAFLAGEKGSGRTSLCLQWLASAHAVERTAYVCCKPGMALPRLREQILNSLLPSTIFDPDDTVADTLFRLMQGRGERIAIVIDDADCAPQECLEELWELYCINAALPQPLQLGVLLCGQTDWVSASVKRLDTQGATPLELDIEPLSAHEQTVLLEHCLRRADYYAFMPNPAALAEKLRQCGGNPGLIVALAEEIMNRKSTLKHKEWPANKVMASVGVVAAVVLLLSWVVPPLLKGGNHGAEQAATSAAVSTAVPTVIPAADSVAVNIEPANLPGDVSGATDLGKHDDGDKRRVVIADTVVRDIMASQNHSSPAVSAAEGSSASVSGAVTSVEQLKPLVKEITTPSAATATEPTASSKSATASAPAAVNGKKPAVPPAAKNKPVAAVVQGNNAELANKPVRHYALQLTAGSDRNAIMAFVAKQPPVERYWVYQTQYQGKPWFVLIQGEYASSAQAKAAANGLPAALKAGHPWPKSFGQIQKELK